MAPQLDVLIRNGTILDGTGKPGVPGNVGIIGDKIAFVGPGAGDAGAVIDATGMVVCPGFIDMHTHVDATIHECLTVDNMVMQGITTCAMGLCGLSKAPRRDPAPDGSAPWRTFEEYLAHLDGLAVSTNLAPMVGHNQVRDAVMDDVRREATSDEVRTMQRHVEEALDNGALGLSAGFDYGTAEYASFEEIVAVARAAHRYGVRYYPHTRHIQKRFPIADRLVHGYDVYHGPLDDIWLGRYRGYLEAIEIGRQAGLPVHIAHLSIAYHIPQPHPAYLDQAMARATLEIIDDARTAGQDVSFDVIPYPHGTQCEFSLLLAFSKWLHVCGKDKLIENLRSREFRDLVKEDLRSGRYKVLMVHPGLDPYWIDGFAIVHSKDKSLEGRNLGEITRARGTHPIDALADLLVDDPEMTFAAVEEKRWPMPALIEFVAHPLCAPCTDYEAYSSDGSTGDPFTRFPAPRAYGQFPYFIDTFVRQTGTITLEDAIFKCTMLPAERLGLAGRGVLRPGAWADVLVFDPKHIAMKSGLFNPIDPPAGIEHVFVNGQKVYQDMRHTGARPGRVLRRK